jgi:hypothetical protein
MSEEEFLAIDWPTTFVVKYKNGRSEILLRGEGVVYIPRDDDPTGRSAISAVLPKKHPRIQSVYGRNCYFDELQCIRDEAGNEVWVNCLD